MTRLLLLSFVALLASASAGCSFSGSESHKINVGGMEREYLLVHPDKGEHEPLVIVLHGGGGTPRVTRTLGFDELAKREHLAVVYPKGIDTHWVDGRINDNDTKNAHVNDVAFLSSLIDALVAQGIADPSRVYVTGISNGGMMTYRAGCDLADKLAAIAPVSGNIPADITCSPSRKLPVLAINGTADPVVPWNGGMVGGDLGWGDKAGKVLPVAQSIAFWRKQDGCGAEHKKALPPIKDNDPTRVIYHTWDGCQVQLYEVVGGGHMWPGKTLASMIFPERLIGKTSQQIDATEIIWAFFADKTR